MLALLAFALTLLVAVLVSALAHRSVLSISVLFLVSGFAKLACAVMMIGLYVISVMSIARV